MRCPRSYHSSRRRVGRSRRYFVRTIGRQPLLVFLDDLLEIFAHFRNRLARHLHLTVRSPPDDNVELAVARVLLRKIVAEVPAAALLSLQIGARDDLRYGQQILKIE